MALSVNTAIAPEEFMIERQSLDGLSVDNAEQSLALIKDALGKQATANGAKAADLIALNAGARTLCGRCAPVVKEGVAMAQDAIGAGLARAKLTDLATFTQVQQDA